MFFCWNKKSSKQLWKEKQPHNLIVVKKKLLSINYFLLHLKYTNIGIVMFDFYCYDEDLVIY